MSRRPTLRSWISEDPTAPLRIFDAVTAFERSWALPTLLRVGLSEVVAYRAEFVVWILTTNMPLVMLAIWHAVAAALR